MHRIRIGALAAVLALGAQSATGADLELPVVEKSLDNGLRLLVLEDHDIPNVALYVVWKVGSRNEVPGITGLAHYFEHMMFMGGAKYGKRFDPVMEARGGSNNAYTSNDVTVYQDWFPADALPLILDMEADRMSGMVFDPETVETERGVVASERRLSMEEPEEVMYEQLWATAFTAHPYQWSVLGWMVDIQNWKLSDLEEFFHRYYSPDNCTVVVVGDVDPDEVHRLVKQKMGGIPRGPERRPVHTQEPEQRGERRVVVEDSEAGLAKVMIAWHTVETAHPDFPVLDVLERLLLVGESSRLYRLLVQDERVCLAVSGGWQGYTFDPSLFQVDLTMREGKGTGVGEVLVYEALAQLAAEGVPDRELRKVKNGLKAALVRRLRTLNGKADLIAETDTFFGGWRNLPERVKHIEAVTSDDVKRVVSKYLRKRNRNVCTLVIGAAATPPAEDGK